MQKKSKRYSPPEAYNNTNFLQLNKPGWVRFFNYKMFTFAGSTFNEHGF